MSYRLAAFDIDGTLIGASGELSPATIAAATSRPYELVAPTLMPLGLEVSVIASAGADVRLAGGAIVDQRTLPEDLARKLASLCDEADCARS